MARFEIINDSQKTYPKYSFIFVQFLISKSFAARPNKNLNWHENHCACLVGQPKREVLNNANKFKVDDCDRGKEILLWTKETNVAP